MQYCRGIFFIYKNTVGHFSAPAKGSFQHKITQTHRYLVLKTQYVLSHSLCNYTGMEIEEDSERDKYEYNELSNAYLGFIAGGQRVFIIQPYVKWGKNKKIITTPQLQLSEAEALINTLPYWQVVDKVCISLLTLQKKKLFGTGSLDNLKTKIKSIPNVTAIFISINTLKNIQVKELQKEFDLPIYDRYSIIINIFREHAQSPEAKLQVALAEVPYIWQKINTLDDDKSDNYKLIEHRKKVLQAQETKLKKKLKKLKEHRELIRSSRQKYGIPSIAVVGYTNAGKTSLIKALTGDNSLEPKNQLFATLDTTTHQGVLPCRMKVLYIDTIGFIQDVPERLIEPFVATLEDAMIADIIVHVYDASHPDRKAQIQHVEDTLQFLLKEKRPIINVANKCDIAERGSVPANVMPVAAVHSTGIELLRQRVQKEILAATGRIIMKMRVQTGSPQEAWLYKEMTVINADTDTENSQYMLLDVITTDVQLFRFKRFLRQ